jgi:hypothetical protein
MVHLNRRHAGLIYMKIISELKVPSTLKLESLHYAVWTLDGLVNNINSTIIEAI